MLYEVEFGCGVRGANLASKSTRISDYYFPVFQPVTFCDVFEE